MPYRHMDRTERCRVCGEPTGLRCCKCGAAVCGDHGRDLQVQFYVQTIACTDEATCHARRPERKTYEHDEEIVGPWGVRMSRRR